MEELDAGDGSLERTLSASSYQFDSPNSHFKRGEEQIAEMRYA